MSTRTVSTTPNVAAVLPLRCLRYTTFSRATLVEFLQRAKFASPASGRARSHVATSSASGTASGFPVIPSGARYGYVLTDRKMLSSGSVAARISGTSSPFKTGRSESLICRSVLTHADFASLGALNPAAWRTVGNRRLADGVRNAAARSSTSTADGSRSATTSRRRTDPCASASTNATCGNVTERSSGSGETGPRPPRGQRVDLAA